jgi:hypothetical protein
LGELSHLVEDDGLALCEVALGGRCVDGGGRILQEIVAAIILGPGRWDSWYAKWAEQYA